LSLLLDTHVLFWWISGDERLTDVAIAAIEEADGQCHVSAVSAFELANKVRLGKFDEARLLSENLQDFILANGFQPLTITHAHAKLAGELAGVHRDPFDRLLAAQAIVEDMAVVTIDGQIAELGARVVW
jgi:PIN domain nuclease of toxin-antitoxin system